MFTGLEQLLSEVLAKTTAGLKLIMSLHESLDEI